MIVAVAGRPPRGDAVDQLAPVGEHDARAFGARHRQRRRRSLHLGVGQPDVGGPARTSRAVGMRSRPHGAQAELFQQCRSRSASGFGVVRSFGAVEDRVGAGQETERLHLLGHVLAPGRQSHHRARHRDARRRDGAHEFERIERGLVSPASGVPSTCTSMLIGTLSGCSGSVASVWTSRRDRSRSRPCRRCRRSRRGCRPRARDRACRAGPGRCGW